MPKIYIYISIFLSIVCTNVNLIKDEKEFKALTKSSNLLVKFFAPWCGHCKALVPEYIKAATNLKEAKIDHVKLVEVDCTQEKTKKLCSKYEIRGYPTIKYFSQNAKQPIEYEGQRTSGDLTLFAKKMVGDAITRIESQKQLDEMIKENDIVVVEYAEKENSKKFNQVANDMKLQYSFAWVQDKKILDGHEMNFEEVAIYRNFDEPKVVYSAKGDIKLSEWIEKHSFPIFGELDTNNYKKYMDKKVPMFWLAVDKSNKQTRTLIENLTKVFKRHREHVFAVYINGVKFKEALKAMGFDEKLPCAMIFDKDNKYKFDQEYTVEKLDNFIQDFRNNKLTMFLKSAKIPKENSGPIYEVVGETFNKIVKDEEVDVVLEYYMIHCPRCKNFAEEYEKLAKKFADSKVVKITRIEGQDNETPVKVEGDFPVVFLFRAGAKEEPLKYTGDMNVDALERWIIENSPLLKKQVESTKKKEL